MHRTDTDSLVRRLVMIGLLAAAVAVGTLTTVLTATGADASIRTRTTERSAPVQPVLTDFTPDPAVPVADPMVGLLDLGPGPIDGLAVEPTTGPGSPDIDSYMAGEGCSIQCITGGVAYARGVGALVEVTTHTPAVITIIVHRDGENSPPIPSAPGQVEFSHHFEDLTPGALYHVTAAATDPDGHTSHAFGSFTTRERHVDISIGSAELLDQAFGSATFDKKIWLEGQWVEGSSVADIQPQGSTVAWGGDQISLGPTDRHLEPAVQLLEQEQPYDCIEAFAPPFAKGPAIGSHQCHHWAFAVLMPWAADLDDRPADATSWVEHTLQRTLYVPVEGDSLRFEVDVTIEVSYQ